MDDSVIIITVTVYFFCAALVAYVLDKIDRHSKAVAKIRSNLKQNVLEKKDLPSLEKALNSLSQHRKRNARDILSRYLNHAGFPSEMKIFVQGWILLILIGQIFLLYFRLTNLTLWLLTGIAIIAPFLILRRLANSRKNTFANQFSSAVDLLVRGIRSGLSVNACIKNVAMQGPAGVRKEFLTIYNDLEVGVPLERAMERFSQRVDLPEARFFSIVVSVQSSSGGNLTTALSNLSDILRTRKQLKGKIQALSAEAKTGAIIIGGVPIMVIALLNFVSPEYMSSLISSPQGQMILLGCVVWMGIGAFVMSKMIDLET